MKTNNLIRSNNQDIPLILKMKEAMQMIARGEKEHPPIAQLLGFKIKDVKDGIALIEFIANKKYHNPMGTLHGGILCDIADAAMGVSFGTTLIEGETYTTLELKINFLKPFREGKLIASGKVVKKGKSIGLVECDISDENGTLVARASSTCMVLKGENAAGR